MKRIWILRATLPRATRDARDLEPLRSLMTCKVRSSNSSLNRGLLFFHDLGREARTARSAGSPSSRDPADIYDRIQMVAIGSQYRSSTGDIREGRAVGARRGVYAWKTRIPGQNPTSPLRGPSPQRVAATIPVAYRMHVQRELPIRWCPPDSRAALSHRDCDGLLRGIRAVGPSHCGSGRKIMKETSHEALAQISGAASGGGCKSRGRRLAPSHATGLPNTC